jgi:hypothetical protein
MWKVDYYIPRSACPAEKFLLTSHQLAIDAVRQDSDVRLLDRIELAHSSTASAPSLGPFEIGGEDRSLSKLPGGRVRARQLIWKQLNSAHAYRGAVVRGVSCTFLTPAEAISWCATLLVHPTKSNSLLY